MIAPAPGLSGTSRHPITIRALNDGAVTIDGQFVHTPIRLRKNAWFVIEGVNAKSGKPLVVWLARGSDNNMFRRLVAWDATINENNSVIGVHRSSGNLFEDVAAFGTSRNARRMRRYGASRQELFERLDQPVLRPLPAEPFVYGEWSKARVNIDYHVEVHHHYYSVPYDLVHEVVEVRVSATTVEALHRGQRVAAHPRDDTRGRHTTNPAHMPKAHQHHLEWTPSRLIQWAATIGSPTAALVAAILADRPHPEQGYRSCLGLLRLSRRDGAARLEAACARAVVVGARSIATWTQSSSTGWTACRRSSPPRSSPSRRSTSICGAGSTTNKEVPHAVPPDPRQAPGAQAARHGPGLDRAATHRRAPRPQFRRALRLTR